MSNRTEIMRSPPILEGRVLTLVRLIWIISAAAAVVIFVASLPGFAGMLVGGDELFGGAPVIAPPRAQRLAMPLIVGFSVLATCVSYVTATLLFWRGHGSVMTVYTSFYLLAYGLLVTGPLEFLIVSQIDYYPVALEIAVTVLTIFATTWLFWLFPNGRFVPRAMRYLMIPSVAVAVIGIMTGSMPGSTSSLPLSFGQQLVLLLMAVQFLSWIVAQLYRYFRVSTPAEQQQTKWVLVGIFFWLVLGITSGIGYTSDTTVPVTGQRLFGSVIWTLAMSIMPIALTVAILRYRLWDVDLIIRRTLQYALTTLLLAGTYYGGVVLLQGAFVRVTGQESPLAVVASTLAIAALFNPLRHRVQNFIDRRFDRRKYNAQRTLDDFAASVRDEVDMTHLEQSLLVVVNETMHPESVSLWVRDEHRENEEYA